MEATPEDQHSQHAQEENFNAYDPWETACTTSYECTVMYSATYRVASDPTTYCATSTYFPWDRKTNGLKRQISNFSAKENRNSMSVGRDTWKLSMLVLTMALIHGFELFLDGMSSSMKQLLETMCGGDFMSKNLEEAMDFLSYVAEVSRDGMN
ncbi:hypothetical protein CK203_110243 [Vitis vinifera]|uniref:Uncharacterized protein n=1 Tax=Vitis vinifera TaxID=29760 RepID=A0A438CVY0_VITVI|nr:hypothetical protein CK203_110243 [Vitis vinifera]